VHLQYNSERIAQTTKLLVSQPSLQNGKQKINGKEPPLAVAVCVHLTTTANLFTT